jgi:hypothetical protein
MTGGMTVEELVRVLSDFPPGANVWLKVDGRVDRPIAAYIDDDEDLILTGRLP